MKSQYYYLVAGLPEISADDAKLTISYIDYLNELMQAISGADESLLWFFRMPYENRNLLAWLKNKEAVLHPLGQLQADDFQEQLQMIDYDNQPALPGVPPYFLTFLREREETNLPEDAAENRLNTLYYEYTQTSPNAFVREWFDFERKLNNTLIALNCRKYNMEIQPHLVGSDDFSQALAGSSARDFNVADVFPQIESLLRIWDEEDLLEREKKVDRLKWTYLDDMSTSYYFTIEVLLAYLVKLQGIERWIQLDPKTGEDIFRHLISDMKKDVKIPE